MTTVGVRTAIPAHEARLHVQNLLLDTAASLAAQWDADVHPVRRRCGIDGLAATVPHESVIGNVAEIVAWLQDHAKRRRRPRKAPAGEVSPVTSPAGQHGTATVITGSTSSICSAASNMDEHAQCWAGSSKVCNCWCHGWDDDE